MDGFGSLFIPKLEGFIIMNVYNTSNHERYTVGLSSLNETAFSRMVACGHRVVSIKEYTDTKFRINTECTSGVEGGRNICQGFMHFTIKNKEVNLYLAHFDHTHTCAISSRFEGGTVESTKPNNAPLRAIIDGAKVIAKSEIEKKERKLSSREAGYDEDTRFELIDEDTPSELIFELIEDTPFELMRAKNILKSLEKLETLFASNETSSSDYQLPQYCPCILL